MHDHTVIDAPPKAAAMLEALRGLGYSTATALADIIDNSIAAGARRVAIQFTWRGPNSVVTILDDGRGMDAPDLERAMRLGEINPLDDRNESDLGRFGLGLKTASFSQARRLTVASKTATAIECLRWDLDILANSKDGSWPLLKGTHNGSESDLEPLACLEHGTLVLWEQLDRVVTEGSGSQDFLNVIDKVERHLAMVFHRYLAGPNARLGIEINGRSIAPWDPFLANHSATWTSPAVAIGVGKRAIAAQCYVLPHKDRLTAQEHILAAGPDGWTAQQGFYVYRNERLLVAGSWLGLGQGRAWTKEEAHRLARIRLDIPNSADAEWKLDIRKSTARPPVSMRVSLTQLADDTRARARRVFAHRGNIVTAPGRAPVAQAWRTEHFGGGLRYRIDREHPLVRAVLDDAGSWTPLVLAMLRVIEETVPVQRIWLDTAEEKETPRTGFAGEPPAAVATVLSVLYKNLLRKGMSPTSACEQLLRTEPFQNYPALVASLPTMAADP